MENILLIDKPVGMTSFDVIRHLRHELGVRKMGHAGTLDPLASGLLIVGVGPGTKKLHEYLKLPKEYEAEILVGERRSTGDMEGSVVDCMDVVSLKETDVAAVLEGMVGTLTLPVSAYSAIKKDGVPMYKRARLAEREGKTIEDVPMREMEVIEAELLKVKCIAINRDMDDHVGTEPSSVSQTDHGTDDGTIPTSNDGQKCVVSVRFSVGSGTYIRSLAEEFGRRLGYPATLKSLRRSKIGEFSVDDARSLQTK